MSEICECGHGFVSHYEFEKQCLEEDCPCKKFKAKKGCGKLMENRILAYEYHCGDIARELCSECSVKKDSPNFDIRCLSKQDIERIKKYLLKKDYTNK